MKHFRLLLLMIVPFLLYAETGRDTKKEGKVRWSIDMKNHAYGYYHKEEKSSSSGGGLPGFGPPAGTSSSNFPENHLTLYNSTRLKAAMKHITFSIQKELFAPIGLTIPEDDDYMMGPDIVYNHGPKHYMERISLEGKWRHFNFTAGDFYLSLNSGMMLSMTPNKKTGDNSIRGARFFVRKKGFSTTVFGGYANPMLRDIDLEKRMKDGWDWLFGTDFSYRIRKMAWHIGYTGAYYLPYATQVDTATNATPPFDFNSEEVKKNFHLIGASWRTINPWKGFSSVAAFTVVADGTNSLSSGTYFSSRDKVVYTHDSHNMAGAHALYLMARQWWDIKKERLTISAEGSRYNRYFLNYDRLEDPDFKRNYFSLPAMVPDNYEVEDLYDNWGMKFRVALAEKALTKLNISFETAFVWPLENTQNESFLKLIHERKLMYFGGSVDRMWKNFSFKILGGYLHKEDINPPSPADKVVEWGYGNILLNAHASKHSWKSTSEIYIKNDPLEQWDNAVDFRQTLDWTIAGRYTFSLLLSYWNDANDSTDEQHYYPGGSFSVHYRWLRTLLFIGQLRGGKVCTGGVCRELPDFSGVKLEFDIKL